jgi:hypothetical protein
MKLTVSGFAGANLAVQPRLLPESVGVNSLNQRPGGADMQPWNAPLEVATVPAAQKTIYRFGRDVASDSQYWFTLANVGHFCRGFIASDTSERTYYTGSDVPRVTDNVLGISAAPYPTASRILGVPKAVNAIVLTQTTAGTGSDELRYYTQTFVTDKGEESAPGPASSITCKPGAIIDFGTLEAAPTNRGITKRRIYRTQAGTSGSADFFFLREDLSTALTGLTDDARALGADTLATTGWEPPPSNLKHLTVLWNGMMAGISGRGIRFCESYKPYAWPVAYEIVPPDVTPVAMVTWSSNLVVLTTGQPRVVTGSVPDGMNDDPTDFDASCISETSGVGFGHGAAWSSPDGLAYIGTRGAMISTAGLLRPEQWRAMAPETIIGSQYEGMYVGFYNKDSSWKGFVVDPVNPAGIYFLSQGYQAAYFDKLRNALFVLDGTKVKKWNADAALMSATFKSKIITLPSPEIAGCVRVIADSYPVTVKVYGDGVLLETVSVASRKPVRLASGHRAIEFQCEVQAQGRVTAVEIASSIRELLRT